MRKDYYVSEIGKVAALSAAEYERYVSGVNDTSQSKWVKDVYTPSDSRSVNDILVSRNLNARSSIIEDLAENKIPKKRQKEIIKANGMKRKINFTDSAFTEGKDFFKNKSHARNFIDALGADTKNNAYLNGLADMYNESYRNKKLRNAGLIGLGSAGLAGAGTLAYNKFKKEKTASDYCLEIEKISEEDNKTQVFKDRIYPKAKRLVPLATAIGLAAHPKVGDKFQKHYDKLSGKKEMLANVALGATATSPFALNALATKRKFKKEGEKASFKDYATSTLSPLSTAESRLKRRKRDRVKEM